MRRPTVCVGWRWVTVVATGTVALGAGSCLVPNPGYCAFEHGDASCGESRGMCVLAREDASHDGIANGCSADVPKGFVRVRYGLPVLIEAPVLRSEDPRFVQGLLERLGYAGCGSADELGAHFEPVIGGVAAVRRHLEARGRTRRSALDLTGEHVAAIEAYDEAVTMWIDRCDAGTGTGSTTVEEETATTAASETATEGSTTTGDDECKGDEECSGCTPFCDLESMACVGCNDMPDPNAACAGLNEQTPVCDGTCCVQCTVEMPEACINPTPVCDAATNVCVPCRAHEECGEAACNLFTGACLPEGEDQVVHVGPGQPYPTLTAALAAIVGPEGTMFVHAGPPSYDESVTVEDGQVIAFRAAELGPDIDPPLWIRNSGNTPQLTVSAGGTVLLDGMQLSGNASTIVPGLLVDGGHARLDRSRVVANLGGGIVAQAEGELVLHNSFVGGDVSDRNALTVSSATATIVYSTLGAGFGTATALTCDAASTMTVRNSLLVSRSDVEINCMFQVGEDSIEHSAAEMSLGGTNIDLLDMNTNWFVNYAAGDFHLAPLAPVALDTTALWRLGDPPTDIDGQPRPMTDNTSDVAGADVP